MKLIKSGVILVFLILLSINVMALDQNKILDLNLTRNKVSPGQVFEGYLNITFPEPIAKSAGLDFYINNKVTTIPIKWIFKNVSNIQTITEHYEKTGSSSPTKLITFNTGGSKVETGIDLSSAVDISEILELNITFKGEPINGVYPKLKVDIGNDGVVDYQYQGDRISYEEVSREYLQNENEAQDKIILGTGTSYCQPTTLKPSKEYKVFAKVNKLNNGAKLKAAITTEPILSDCSIETCCDLPTTSTLATQSCSIPKEINDEGEYYLCIAVFDGTSDIDYYQLAAGVDNSNVKGFYDGNPTNINYFITSQRALYDTNLKETPQKKNFLDTDMILDYISRSGCTNNCIIPINITSETKGKITLSDLNLKYIDSNGRRIAGSFGQIKYVPESINYTGKSIYIKLEDIENLTAPIETAVNNKIFARFEFNSLGIKNSKEFIFDIVQGPKAFISYDQSYRIGLNQLITFDASRSRQAGNNEIIEYHWDLGDGDTSTNKTISHKYNRIGNYTVKLTVIDEEGLVGKNNVIILVGTTTQDITKDIEQAFENIKISKDYMTGLSSQGKDTAELLGINEKIRTAETNLTNINTTITTVLKSGQSSEDKETKISKARESINQILNDLPIGLSVSISTFDGKLVNKNDIPSNIGEGDTKDKIFIAQENIKVDGEARVVDIKYANGETDNFIIVKKKVKGGSGDVYEIIPSYAEVVKVLNGVNTKVSDNILKFTQSEYSYILKGELGDAIKTISIQVPSDLDSITIDDNASEVKEENLTVTSNKSVLWFGIIVLVIILIGLYFAFYFKGGFVKRVPKKTLFKSEMDHHSLLVFVRNSLHKGIKEERIIEALKKKGWNDQQISTIFEEIHGKKIKI